MVNKKYHITFSPQDARRARFVHREFDTKEEAKRKMREILKNPTSKRKMLNPRISKNPFYKD